MKIVGCLSWYEERASWLSAAISSLHGIVDHLIAVDGAYFLYPDGKARSGSEQHEAIVETCRGLGIGCTLHVPSTVWFGNEVEKRSFMFGLAEQVAMPNEDWYLIQDADQVVTRVPLDLKQRLEASSEGAAKVSFSEARPSSRRAEELARQFVWPSESRGVARLLFRAIPGLRPTSNHYTYATSNGHLWGPASLGGSEDLDLKDMEIEHRTAYRDMARLESQRTYYKRRDAVGAEVELDVSSIGGVSMGESVSAAAGSTQGPASRRDLRGMLGVVCCCHQGYLLLVGPRACKRCGGISSCTRMAPRSTMWSGKYLGRSTI